MCHWRPGTNWADALNHNNTFCGKKLVYDHHFQIIMMRSSGRMWLYSGPDLPTVPLLVPRQ